MTEETLASQGIPPAKVAEDVESNGVAIETIEDNLGQIDKQGRKGDKTALDSEFLKLEKKFFDVKEGSHSAEKNYVADREPSLIENADSNLEATTQLLESQEKIELEDELLRISCLLKESESENTNLKDQILLSNARHRDNHDKLLEQISETEERHNLQLTTMQNALQAQEEKNEELINAKEDYDGLSLELESSQKKVVDLELDLQNSTDEAGKFKELHRQSGFLAASEAKKALEFERLLQLAKFSAIEVENQMASLQEEVKILYEKIAENQKLEEKLKSTSAELSTIHRELELSKSQVQNLEQRLASKETVNSELTRELKLARNFESKSKEDIASLENLLSSMKENLQEKVSNLEDVKLKLKEEVSEKEEVEEHLKSRETKIKIIQEELAKVNKEKLELENAVTDLTSNISQMKELCNELEAKLQQSDENFCIVDSLLSQAVTKNKEVEQKLKTLEDLHTEFGYAMNTANQKNLELEDMLQALNTAAEEAKLQLRESETHCIMAEQKNIELVQQLNLVELRAHDAQSELRELSDKLLKLNVTLGKELEEKEQLDTQIKEFQSKVTAIGSDLGKSTARNLEVELELKNYMDKCAEHEGQANIIHQRCLEFEQLMQTSDSKAVDTGKNMSEIELLLDAEKHRIKDLEERISLLDKKCQNVEAEFLKSSKEVSELEAQLEVVQLNASNLEVALQASHEKEKELTEFLNLTAEENRNLKDVSKTSNDKLFEAENLLNILRNELNIYQQRFESIENDKALLAETNAELNRKVRDLEEKLIAAVAEIEISDKQLASHTKTISEFTERDSKVSELQLAAKGRFSEAEVEESAQKFSLIDLETKDLHDKVKASEELVKIYDEETEESSFVLESRELELEQTFFKSRDLDREFLRNSTEFEKDTEALVKANTKLTLDLVSCECKLSDLQNKLYIASSKKDDAIEEKSIARKEIEVLTQQLASEDQTLQSLASSVMEENNLLHETHKCSQKHHLPLHGKKLSSQKELEQDVSSKYSFVELEAKKKEILLLATQVKELERRLQLADAESKEKDVGGATIEPKDETTKSQDTESFTSTPSKRKSKKKSEVNSAEAFSLNTQMQTPEVFSLMTFKLFLAVALVSVIVGIILGKRY